MKLTAKRLHELLEYEPRTGLFRWKINGRGCYMRKGAIAGTIRRKNGYRQVQVDGKLYLAGRLAFLFMIGRWPKHCIDHKNRKTSDDRWSNLREATTSQNGGNMKDRPSRGPLKGMTFNSKRGKWISQICVNRKIHYVGQFDRPEDAHAAYLAAAKKHFGEFARG